MTLFDLSGRTALVTGSSRGIGAAIALGLAEAGADVAVHYAGSRAQAEALAERIRGIGRRSVALGADLGTPGEPGRLFEAAVNALGAIDILVSNVAVQIPEPWDRITAEHFESQVRTNWQSGFELIQKAAPAMLERGWGRILTVGSVQEAKPHPDMVVYSALKAAQTLTVRNLAKQFAGRGVTVNNLAPGVIETDRNTGRLAAPAYQAKVLAQIPAGRVGDVRDCVGAALLLCSEAGRYITGQSLLVDGGMSL
jgi:NAD(P)-dependent dehydrogenase (short-subunit alcohol dehydrogenase family)